MSKIAETPNLIPMDIGCLLWLADYPEGANIDFMPTKIFVGEIPGSHPDLVALGLVEHVGELTFLTAHGQATVQRLAAANHEAA